MFIEMIAAILTVSQSFQAAVAKDEGLFRNALRAVATLSKNEEELLAKDRTGIGSSHASRLIRNNQTAMRTHWPEAATALGSRVSADHVTAVVRDVNVVTVGAISWGFVYRLSDGSLVYGRNDKTLALSGQTCEGDELKGASLHRLFRPAQLPCEAEVSTLMDADHIVAGSSQLLPIQPNRYRSAYLVMHHTPTPR